MNDIGLSYRRAVTAEGEAEDFVSGVTVGFWAPGLFVQIVSMIEASSAANAVALFAGGVTALVAAAATRRLRWSSALWSIGMMALTAEIIAIVAQRMGGAWGERDYGLMLICGFVGLMMAWAQTKSAPPLPRRPRDEWRDDAAP